MKESLILKEARVQKFDAIGKVTLELKDPVTGRVKERISGKNHVFLDMLVCELSTPPTYGFYRWDLTLDSIMLAINGDDTPVNPDVPLLMGQGLGYGIPNAGSSGVYKGAYNAANQVLGQVYADRKRWLYQYDFTTAQANGTIKNIGLTNQYRDGKIDIFPTRRRNTSLTNAYRYWPSDGRYAYGITGAGVLTKIDGLLNNIVALTVNLSAIVGSNAADIKSVGYNPVTGKYYVFVGSATPASRKMYIFSDSNFSVLESTLSPSAITINTAYPFYVYGDNAYFLTGTANTVYKANFVDNTVQTTLTLNATRHVSCGIENSGQVSSILPNLTSLGTPDGIYMGVSVSLNSTRYLSCFFDPSSDTVKASFGMTHVNGDAMAVPIIHPDAQNRLPSTAIVVDDNNYGNKCFGFNGAKTAYVLPTPVVKTSANGLTVTYELEVFY